MEKIEGLEIGRALAGLSAWKTGGSAEYFLMPTSVEALEGALLWAEANGLAVNVISGGTNLLVADEGVAGLVICLRKLKSPAKISKLEGRLHLDVLAGTSKLELLRHFLKEELAPALFLAGLPGDVGGGVVMNAGVGEAICPREFCELVDWVEVLRLKNGALSLKRILTNELNWEYRHCLGWQPGIITRVGLSWPLEPQVGLKDLVKKANKNRLLKQPLDEFNCGSVFRNPEGDKAGRLIEAAGLKGYTIGDAQVSIKHANFIVNRGEAESKDILDLIQHVQSVVSKKSNVLLKREVILMGFGAAEAAVLPDRYNWGVGK